MEQSKSESEKLPGGTETNYSVFLSYSRADQKLAVPVIEALEGAGFSVWWDGLLEGGERFARTTETVLENAKAVVVLWSKTSIDSHWVHDEATRGRDRRCLVPLTIDGSDPPLGFRQFQVIDISGAKGRTDAPEIGKMLHAVAALHDMADIPDQIVPRSSARVERRTVLIGGATAVLAASGLAAWNWDVFGGGQSQNSVAVLPFINVSGDPEKAYFSDGLAAEIRSELSRNTLLQIVGQASSNNFRDREEDAKTISQKLGVAYLLDGNVRISGNTLRIGVELTEGDSGFSKWSQTFDRPLTNVFAVQSEIAAAVASALSAEIDGEDTVARSKQIGGTESVAAFDAYLRGKDLYALAIDESSDRQALAKFEQAIAADKDYAAAHAARSRTLAVIANQYVEGAGRISLYEDAVAAAERAVAIAPELADAHSALGYALFYGRLDVKGARKPYDQSFTLGQGNADVLSRFALYSARTGRFAEADRAISRSKKLDPLNPVTSKSQGIIKLAAHEYEAAIMADQEALSLNPKISGVNADMGRAMFLLGNIDDAFTAYEKEPSSLFGLPGIAIIERFRGNEGAAQTAFDRLVSDHGDNGLYQQAQVLAQWGQTDNALTTLEKAYEARDAGLTYARNDALLDPLRAERRFIRLIRKLGFS